MTTKLPSHETAIARRGTLASLLMTIATVAAFTSCAMNGGAERDKPSAQARMLERRSSKGWTPVDDAAAGGDPIRAVLKRSHLRARPFLPASATLEEEQEADAPQEKKTPGVKKVEPGEQEKPPKLIAVRLRGMPLNQVVEMIADPLGLNIVLPQDLVQPVTVNFPAIAPRAALDAILANHGMELQEQKGVFRIRPRASLPGLVSRTYTIKTGRALDEKQLQAFLTPERGTLSLNSDQKTFVVIDEEAAHERIEAFLALMDRRVPQVLIEAVIMEVQHSDNLAWGGITNLKNINIRDYGLNLTSTLTPAPAPPFTVGVAGDNDDVVSNLSAGRSIDKINLLSNPLLSTVSGKEARLEVIEKVPYIKESTSLQTQGNTQTTAFSEVEFMEVGVRLTVTPTVGEDGIIEMQVKPEILELVDFFLNTPVVDERRVTTTVYVRNNETLVIGGLLRESSLKKTTKVPILGDIPLLGYLFRSEDNTEEKVELLIFLTPHLLSAGADTLDGFHPTRHFLEEKDRFPTLRKNLENKGE